MQYAALIQGMIDTFETNTETKTSLSYSVLNWFLAGWLTEAEKDGFLTAIESL